MRCPDCFEPMDQMLTGGADGAERYCDRCDKRWSAAALSKAALSGKAWLVTRQETWVCVEDQKHMRSRAAAKPGQPVEALSCCFKPMRLAEPAASPKRAMEAV